MTRGRIVGIAVALALGGWAAWAFRPVPVPVELGVVVRGPLVATIDEDARTRVVDRFVVHAPLAGDLLRPDLRAGDEVTEGTVIARIVPRAAPLLDPRERESAASAVHAARAAVEAAAARTRRADADVEHARIELGRVRALHDQGEAPRAELDAAIHAERAAAADLDSARFSEQVARFELRQAEAALAPGLRGSRTVDVPSPVTARVLRVLESSGGPVEAGQHLVELGDPRRLEVVADLLTSDAVHVASGARVVLEGWGDGPIEGRVRRIEPSAVTKVSALGVEEQRVDVLIEPVAPPDAWARVGDGFALDARVVTWESSDVLLAPASALFRSGDGWAAFVVRDGRARRQGVRPGHRTAAHVEVLSGLAAADVVVVHPSDDVRDGARVRERPREAR